MKDGVTKCKFCGKQIAIITWGVYRKCVVDADAVMVEANPEGEEFVRVDGTKVKGFEADFISDKDAEPAYRMHGMSCGRKPS